MTDTIQPALTPDEWTELDGEDRFIRHVLSCYADGIDNLADLGAQRRDPTSCLHVTAAIANHALPSDDPRRLTRVDLQVLREIAGYLEEHGRHHEDLDATIAKIEAILPPEPQ